jgi:hypothetical protein
MLIVFTIGKCFILYTYYPWKLYQYRKSKGKKIWFCGYCNIFVRDNNNFSKTLRAFTVLNMTFDSSTECLCGIKYSICISEKLFSCELLKMCMNLYPEVFTLYLPCQLHKLVKHKVLCSLFRC